MSTIKDLKIHTSEYTGKDISGLPNKPSEAGYSASELKAMFDSLVKNLTAVRFNQLIDVLTTAGAKEITIEQIDGMDLVLNVQDALAWLTERVLTLMQELQGVEEILKRMNGGDF